VVLEELVGAGVVEEVVVGWGVVVDDVVDDVVVGWGVVVDDVVGAGVGACWAREVAGSSCPET